MFVRKLCVDKLFVSKLCVDKLFVSKLFGDKLCVGKLCVSKLCVNKLCVSKLCVSELCVDKLCVDKLCGDKLCVSKLCTRASKLYGDKLCEQVVWWQVVCDDKLCVVKLCVSKLCWQVLCGDKLCGQVVCEQVVCVQVVWWQVGQVVCGQAAGGEAGGEVGGEVGVHNQKQEPHTKMLGKTSYVLNNPWVLMLGNMFLEQKAYATCGTCAVYFKCVLMDWGDALILRLYSLRTYRTLVIFCCLWHTTHSWYYMQVRAILDRLDLGVSPLGWTPSSQTLSRTANNVLERLGAIGVDLMDL